MGDQGLTWALCVTRVCVPTILGSECWWQNWVLDVSLCAQQILDDLQDAVFKGLKKLEASKAYDNRVVYFQKKPSNVSQASIFHMLYSSHFLLSSYDNYPDWDTPQPVWDTALASIILDYILAGSELIHRIKLHMDRWGCHVKHILSALENF